MPMNESQYVFLLRKVYEQVQRLGSVGRCRDVITLLYNIPAKCPREVTCWWSNE